MRRGAVVFLVTLACFCACSRRPTDVAAREKLFQESLNGATLIGHFTVGDQPGLKEDRYVIEGLTKLGGSTWLFRARVENSKFAIPMPLTVEWAGDTPMVTLTDFGIPGLGTFTARVLFYGGQYAGTWSGGKAGGLLFGRIVKH